MLNHTMMSEEQLNLLRAESEEICELATKLMFHHIYQKQIPFRDMRHIVLLMNGWTIILLGEK